MIDVLRYIEKMKEMYEGERITAQGPRNMADGGRIGYDDGQLVRNTVDGSRPGYATSTVKKGKFIYPVTNQHGTIYSDKKPKKHTHEVGSGKFNMAERNRVTRIKFPEYNSYLELLKKEPAKAKNVMAALQNSLMRGTKITKKTVFTPLTEIQQNKILLEFPDAVFSKGKFGFNAKTDQTKFVQVKNFIKRGYKPKFAQLPDKVKNELKEKFSHFKDWDFKKFKYGVPETLNNVDNRRLMQKVKTFINDPKPWRFGFSMDQKGAWMTNQMYRAWEHGNTDYEPIYNKNDKVIGMKEKGKAYYANENVAPSKKAALINSHSEFNNIQKFVDVANEAKLPLKDLKGYKNTKALLALFPEGYEKIKFSDLTNYLYKEAGADATRNAIEKHHLKALSDIGSATDAKNLQLLRQDLNTLGNTVAEQIKKGDFSRVSDLEKAGVKIIVDGKTYGKGFQDPRRQLGSLIGETTQKIKSLDEQQFKNLLIKLCPKGKASGGRIGYSTGTPTVACGMDQLTKYLKNGVPKTERTLVSRILGMGNKLIKGAGQILNPLELFKLRNWVSPQALAAFGLFETAFVADDVLRKDKPLNEAVAGNWFTNIGGFLDEEVEKAKNILGSNKYQLSPAAKEYAQSLIDIKNYNDLDNYEKVYGMAGAAHTITPEIREKVESDKKTLYDKIMKTPTTGQLDYENILGEKEATWKGKAEDAPFFGYDSFTSGQTKKQIVPGEYIQKKGQLPEPKITDVPDYYVSENYKTSFTPTNEVINKYLQSIGERSLKSGEGTLIRMQQPGAGLYGTQDRFAGGGIASIRKPSEIPPERGGLRSIMINGKKY